jgi:predicted DNA-binding transcriptional regulator AlpA
MPARSPNETVKAAISVSAMAKAVGLSRNHFFALCKKGVFPPPIYAIKNRRPFFTAELQEQCQTIRKTNISHSGEYVIFYEPRSAAPSPNGAGNRPRSRTCRHERLGQIAANLRQLGLTVTEDQVQSAVAEVFPGGISDDENQVIRVLFSHFRRSIPR